MRISNLNAPERCTPAGQFKDNTFSMTIEMTASELSLFISALEWQQQGMQQGIDEGSLGPNTVERWAKKIVESQAKQQILVSIGAMTF